MACVPGVRPVKFQTDGDSPPYLFAGGRRLAMTRATKLVKLDRIQIVRFANRSRCSASLDVGTSGPVACFASDAIFRRLDRESICQCRLACRVTAKAAQDRGSRLQCRVPQINRSPVSGGRGEGLRRGEKAQAVFDIAVFVHPAHIGNWPAYASGFEIGFALPRLWQLSETTPSWCFRGTCA